MSSFYQFVSRHYNLPVTFDVTAKNPTLVKSVLPVDQFNQELEAARAADAELAKVDRTELLVLKLLDYFKNEFFSWVDALDCVKCSTKCRLLNVQQPPTVSEELANYANSTEIYQCPSCGTLSRFPRYNDPRRLLVTRRGRCGEWANAFAYILHCLDIPVRLVYCTSDHVWIEFYNATAHRWIHADPCEAEMDNPLLYQAGWGKTIDLVVARGEREIRDVTWRYTAKWKSTADDRRRKLDERRLAEVVNQWNVALQAGLDFKERQVIAKRWVEEVVEFIRLPGEEEILPSAKASQGRKSGSIAWRLSRAETSSASSCSTSAAAFAFKLRCIPGKTQIAYNCALDRYRVDYPTEGADYLEFRRWSTCTAHCVNVFRNVELDWKMAYLARNKGSQPEETGRISWRFQEEEEAIDDSTKSRSAKWSTIEVKISGQTFESGTVELALSCGPKLRRIFRLNERLVLTRESALKEVGDEAHLAAFEIEAILTGGSGNVAWQHGQLFRQSTERTSSLLAQEMLQVTVLYE